MAAHQLNFVPPQDAPHLSLAHVAEPAVLQRRERRQQEHERGGEDHLPRTPKRRASVLQGQFLAGLELNKEHKGHKGQDR